MVDQQMLARGFCARCDHARTTKRSGLYIERYGSKYSLTGVGPGSTPLHFLKIDLGLWKANEVSKSPIGKRPLENNAQWIKVRFRQHECQFRA